MRRVARAFAAASCLLLAAAAVQAAELDRPPFQAPVGPIEPGILDPIDPCLLHPELCGPPPDPCLENPELCQPEPPDPCDLAPGLCVCKLAPALCEDPPVLEPAEPVGHHLFGGAVVKAEGIKVFEGFPATLSFDTSARTFLLMTELGAVYTGNLAPKGKSGRKFSLFLDDASSDAFTAFVAARGAAAAGDSAGTVLGDSTRFVLKLDEAGAVSLKIRSDVLTSGVGNVVFKVTLTPSEDRP
jgi:hypothetical protein